MALTKIRLLASLSLYCLLIIAGQPVHAEQKNIDVIFVIHEKDELHKRLVTEFKRKLKKKHHSYIKYHFRYTNKTINALDLKNASYVISVGTLSAQKVLQSGVDTPVLFTLVPENTLNQLFAIYSHPAEKDHYSVYLTQPITRKLNLARIIVKDKVKAGFTFGQQTENIANTVLEYSNEKKLETSIKYAKEYDDPLDAMREALYESDIFIAVYDSEILNRHSAKWLLYMAYKMNKPLLGFSEAYTRAGAVASIYSTPEQIGQQSGEWLVAMLNKSKVAQFQRPKYFTISVNERIQRILKLAKLTASELKTKLKAMEARAGK